MDIERNAMGMHQFFKDENGLSDPHRSPQSVMESAIHVCIL